MSQNWYSIYVPLAEAPHLDGVDARAAVAETLRSSLVEQEYQAYDPFPGGTGTPPDLTGMVRLFCAPEQDGWVRVLGQVPPAVLAALSTTLAVPVLSAWLTEDSGGLVVVDAGHTDDSPGALVPFLKPGQSPDAITNAREGAIAVPLVDGGAAGGGRGGKLPPELEQLARDKGVSTRRAGKMFDRLGGNLLRKLGGSDDDDEAQAQARQMLMGGGHDIWNSLDGQRLRALAGLLRLPDNWRQPAFETLRDAYQLHRLRQKNPRIPLMPGDKETMAAVKDALNYVPVYMGRK